MLYQQNSATFIQKIHRKLEQKGMYMLAKSWRPFTRYGISLITRNCIKYNELNIDRRSFLTVTL